MYKYACELEDIIILRLYIDDVKIELKAFKDVKMFGIVLNICGYHLNLDNTKYEYVNACCVEYHVKMFNKVRDKQWTVERFMRELNMTSVDEGVSLRQLIPLYII